MKLGRFSGKEGELISCRRQQGPKESLVGRTRVYLDRVKDLGRFLELEVALQEGELPEAGVQEAHTLMARFGIVLAKLIDGASVDLLSQRGT